MASNNTNPNSPIPQDTSPPDPSRSRSSTRHSSSISPTPTQPANPVTLRSHQGRTYNEQLDNVLRELRMQPELFMELSSQLLLELGIGTSDLNHPRQFMSSIQYLKEDYDNNKLASRYCRPLTQNGRLARLRHLYSELSISSSARSFSNPQDPGASFHIQAPHVPDTPPMAYPRSWTPQQLQANLELTDITHSQNSNSMPYPSNRWYEQPSNSQIQGDRPPTPEQSRSAFNPQSDPASNRQPTSPRSQALSYVSVSPQQASVSPQPNSTQFEIIPPRHARYSSPGPDNNADDRFNAFTPSFHYSRGNGTFERHAPPHRDNARNDIQPHSRRSQTPSHHSQSHHSQSHADPSGQQSFSPTSQPCLLISCMKLWQLPG
ncbi:hypothetical protein BJ912DRAFT_1060573 [Pholiota molesta]|nr:hypothetical protein BJ912DRAFT_1060573 [Pholiota molesta]